MNVAIILAGGIGRRMHREMPKQFIKVKDKPLIIYTLETFQKHPHVDAILAICVDGWQEVLQDYAIQYEISKLRWIVNGGDTVQESIRNGVCYLEGICSGDDIAIIHDGIRPMTGEEILSDVIEKCEAYGNAVTSTPINEQIFIVEDEFTSRSYIPRETLRKVTTPQAYKYGRLLKAYKKAFQEGIGIYGSSYANTLMAELGETLHFAIGSDKNLKITTQDDLELFKAMLFLSENK